MVTMPVERSFYVSSPFGQRTGAYAGMHWGTDFGAAGGSGGRPIFAVKDGRVTRSGPASGFGQWITVDHPASNGGGLTVYGHIIPEVAVGQSVREGQRIGRIDPSSATNGGVAPHLHLEWHRYIWSQPGADRLDPMTKLAGARWPGEPPTNGGSTSVATIFGVDVSEHQDGMSLAQAAREGIQFAIIRTTDGTYRDRCYHSHLIDAEGAGLVTAAYHYLRNPSEGTSVAAQVAASVAVMGDKRRPIWLDCETSAGLSAAHIREFKQRFEAAGVRVIGAYSYVPWWENRVIGGEPDSHEFGKFWVAAYGADRVGLPAALYPGDGADQWNHPLGNQKPALWQFGSRATVAGRQVDINAFRGSKAQLRALFYGGNAEEDDMTPDQARKLNEIHHQLLNAWPQLGGMTLVDAVAQARADARLALDQLVGPARDIKGPKFTGWLPRVLRASVATKEAAGSGLTAVEQMQKALDRLDDIQAALAGKK